MIKHSNTYENMLFIISNFYELSPVPLLGDLRDPAQLLPVPHPVEAEDPSAAAEKEPLGSGERRSTLISNKISVSNKKVLKSFKNTL